MPVTAYYTISIPMRLAKSHEDWQVLQARNAVTLWAYLLDVSGIRKKALL